MSIKVEMGYFDMSKTMNKYGIIESCEVPYFVFGAEDEEAALQAVLDTAPTYIDYASFDTAEIIERISDTTFKVRAVYERNIAENMSAETIFAFDTGGGTKHIGQSLATISRTGDAPDFGGAIGVDNDGNINGVDVTMPIMHFSETHYFYGTQVTTSYKKRLAELTGKVNDSSFKGYDAGEVLFMGASGSKQGIYDNDMWEITFNFAVSTNVTNFAVGSLVVSKKLGWEYLWVRYDNELSEDSKNLIKKPVGAYVEQVYESGSFGGLGIGT